MKERSRSARCGHVVLAQMGCVREMERERCMDGREEEVGRRHANADSVPDGAIAG
jgi:hypothetical protein